MDEWQERFWHARGGAAGLFDQVIFTQHTLFTLVAACRKCQATLRIERAVGTYQFFDILRRRNERAIRYNFNAIHWFSIMAIVHVLRREGVGIRFMHNLLPLQMLQVGPGVNTRVYISNILILYMKTN